jgi:alpha-D-xyloside xylohydrolase
MRKGAGWQRAACAALVIAVLCFAFPRPARAIDEALLNKDLIAVFYEDCLDMRLAFEPIGGGVPVWVSIKDVRLDGAAPPRCSQPLQESSDEVSALIETASGRMLQARVIMNPDGVQGAMLLEITPGKKGPPIDWEFSFSVHEKDHFYGFGEKFNALDMRGRVTRILNKDKHAGDSDDPAFFDDRSYKAVPFFMSSRGYGVWLDDPAVSYFDMDSKGQGKWTLHVKSERLRLYFFAGPRLADILARYTHFSGRPPLWPAWVFAPWKSRDVHMDRTAFEEDIFRQRELDIPGSVIVIDSPWETCYNDFRFNEKQFKNPEQMLQLAHDNGYKVVLWITPMVNTVNIMDMIGIGAGQCRNFDPIEKNSGFVLDDSGHTALVDWWKGRGAMIDFTNPNAASYWTGKIKDLIAMGADGFKVDDGESQFAIKGVYHDGSPGYSMQNYYAVLYHKFTYQAIEESLKGDGVVFARAGAAGTQQYGIPWAGDNFADFSSLGLPSVVIAGQSAAMSGYSVWGHDIGGYITRPHRGLEGEYTGERQTLELFMRWTQFGALSPVMQMHTTSNKGAWDFGLDALSNYIKYAKLHTQLYPYLHALNLEASRTGMPMMRPLPLAYQNQAQAHEQRYEYLLGPDLLAAPVVTEGALARDVYFPAGEAWVDFYHEYGKEYEGGSVQTVPAPLDEMPLFARKGAVIPMLPSDVDTLVSADMIKGQGVTPMDGRLEIHTWPGERDSLFSGVNDLAISINNTEGGKDLCVSGWLSKASIIVHRTIDGDARTEYKDFVPGQNNNCVRIY